MVGGAPPPSPAPFGSSSHRRTAQHSRRAKIMQLLAPDC